MKTVKVNLYQFGELSKDVQEKVIQKWYENEDYPCLSEDLINELAIIDKGQYWKGPVLSYSLGYCQGDGLSFSGTFDLFKWIKNRHKEIKTVDFDNICNAVRFISNGNKGHYYCYCSRSDTEKDVLDYDLEEKYNLVIDKLEEEIADYYIDLCEQLEKYGYSILEYRMTVEEFAEMAEANGYYFHKDGTRY